MNASFRTAALALSLPLLATLAGAAQPRFRITDLGYGTPVAINEKSAVLLQSGSNWIPHAVWKAGARTDVTEGGNLAFDLSDSGVVSGAVLNADYSTTPASWKPGKAAKLYAVQYAPTGVNRATGINAAGTMAGWVVDTRGWIEPAVWSTDGSLHSLALLTPEDASYASWMQPKINAKGVVSIPGWNHAMRVDPASGKSDLLLGFGKGLWYPMGDGYSSAQSINDKGVVVGYSHATFPYADGSTGARYQATMWKADNKPIDLGVLTNLSTYPNVNSLPASINNANVVVGTVATGGSWGGPSLAFGWTQASGMVDLNGLIDPADPLYGQVVLIGANAINDKNEIVGTMSGTFGVHAYLLTLVK